MEEMEKKVEDLRVKMEEQHSKMMKMYDDRNCSASMFGGASRLFDMINKEYRDALKQLNEIKGR